MGHRCIGQNIKVGADAPIPPNTMNAAAPDGAPPRRFYNGKHTFGKVLENLVKMGVKGVLPLGCLPLWGREGVTLLYPEED